MKSRQTTLLLGTLLAAIAVLGSYKGTAHPAGAAARLACYVALANDLTPLVNPGAPEIAASGTECARTGRPANAV